MSAWSSCRALGYIVICSINGSVHAAFRSTYQSPACHSGAAANMRAVLPPSGLISITPGVALQPDDRDCAPVAPPSKSLRTRQDHVLPDWQHNSFVKCQSETFLGINIQ